LPHLAGRWLCSYHANGCYGKILLRWRTADTNSDADGNFKPDSYANGDGDIHSDGNSDSNGNAYAITDSYGDGHIHSYGDCDGNAYADRDGNSNCHSNGDCDRTATGDTNAAASADTAASPLAFFGIRGARENKLASSQPQLDRLLLNAIPN
jgi:hypothetical protein